MESVGECHRGDLPGVLGLDDPVRGGVGEPGGDDTAGGHEEGSGEPVGFLLGVGAMRDTVRGVENKVPEFVGGVEPASFSRLHGIEEDERRPVPVQGEGIDCRALLGQRKDPNSAGLQQVDHVVDGGLPKAPARADDFCGGLGIEGEQ